MEELSLIYSVPHNVIICHECGFAFLCPTIQQHLQRYHNYQQPRLQEVLVEVYSKSPAVRREEVMTLLMDCHLSLALQSLLVINVMFLDAVLKSMGGAKITAP